MFEALAPFAKEGIGIFALVIVGFLFYYTNKNMAEAFKDALNKFADESAKGHQAKIDEIHLLNSFIRDGMAEVIKENTASNSAVVVEMKGVHDVIDRTNLMLDRVERKIDGK